MGWSMLDKTACMTADGVRLSGGQDYSSEKSLHPVEYFLLVVQNEAVARGKGKETSPTEWVGEATTQQGQLSPGRAMVSGLAVVGTNGPVGTLTFSWSAMIELT